jgi:hypothetical protein
MVQLRWAAILCEPGSFFFLELSELEKCEALIELKISEMQPSVGLFVGIKGACKTLECKTPCCKS